MWTLVALMTEAAKDLKRNISKAKKRSSELDVLIKKLYESFATEKISEKRLLSGEYEQEQAEFEKVLAQEEAELTTFNADTDRVKQFLALAKKYTGFSVLTTSMIYEFIDRIIVHSPTKIGGARTQEIEIYLIFVGKFEVPMPEPTTEELAEQEKARQKREYYRQRGKRQREREKKKREAAALEQPPIQLEKVPAKEKTA